MIQGNTIVTVGILVIIIGFILIFTGTALQSSSKTSDVKTGGVILIGPIPIIFGSDKGTIVTAVIMAIILMIIVLILAIKGLF
jgi:uncharacterized protein (TIGR00304 family)